MNYYPFHLGDYATHTGHLEPLEDLAYRRMLDLYYTRECALPENPDEICRLVRMRDSKEEVCAVLNEFFELSDDGWSHSRCDKEIAKMKDKQAKAKASAEASVRSRSANAQRTLNERSADVELPTPTPTPLDSSLRSESVAPKAPKKRGCQIADDFEPDETGTRVARELGLKRSEIQRFVDYHKAKGSVMKDWQAAWRTWASRAAEYARSPPAPGKMTRDEGRAAAAAAFMRPQGFNDDRTIDITPTATPELGF